MKFAWFYVLAILVTLPLWLRLIRRDKQLVLLYIAGLLGAMIGAKICYVSVEGWADWPQPDRLLRLLAGKSILGALFGGFITVELVKKLHGIERVTGDFFAIIVPLGIGIGRTGCILNGCCGGIDGWPAPHVEMGFNLAFAAIALTFRARQRGQWFHIYLIAYGVFRFFHEFLRATPKCCHGIGGYQIWALLLAALGAFAYEIRRREFQSLEKSRV